MKDVLKLNRTLLSIAKELLVSCLLFLPVLCNATRCDDFYSQNETLRAGVGTPVFGLGSNHIAAEKTPKVIKPHHFPVTYALQSSHGELKPLDTFTQVGLLKSNFPKEGQTLTFSPRPEPLEIEAVREVGEYVHLRLVDPKGKRVYLLYSYKMDMIQVVNSHQSLIPFIVKTKPILKGQEIRKITDAAKPIEVSIDQLAETMMLNQINSDRTDSKIMENITAAYKYVLTLKRSISLQDIEEVNRLVNLGNLIHDYSLYAGITRGTKKQYSDGTIVDLTDYNVFGWRNGKIIFEYTPADQVSAKLQDIVHKINSFKDESSLTEVLSIFQEIMILQPFADGNKRTARILVDYALRKIGAPPFPHNLFPSHSFYKSIYEIEQFYREFYNLP
ncbi:MAG: Fic family protein [Deltaproteobacteria bacterium]|nr:Fic family protein [Deltaproteobacteria bacterium]